MNRRTMELQARKLLVKQQKPPRPTRENKTYVTEITRELEKLFYEETETQKTQRKQDLSRNTAETKSTNRSNSVETAPPTIKNEGADILNERLGFPPPTTTEVEQKNKGQKKSLENPQSTPRVISETKLLRNQKSLGKVLPTSQVHFLPPQHRKRTRKKTGTSQPVLTTEKGGRTIEKGGRTITCYNCRKRGHYAKECETKSRKENKFNKHHNWHLSWNAPILITGKTVVELTFPTWSDEYGTSSTGYNWTKTKC